MDELSNFPDIGTNSDEEGASAVLRSLVFTLEKVLLIDYLFYYTIVTSFLMDFTNIR